MPCPLRATLLDALMTGEIVGEALDGDDGIVEEALGGGRSVGGQGGELLESTSDT